MGNVFNAREFFDKLTNGFFDGRVNEEIQKLSRQQLEEVARLMADHERQRKTGTGSVPLPEAEDRRA